MSAVPSETQNQRPHASHRKGVRVQIEGLTAVKLGGERFRWDDAYSALFSMRASAFIATYVAIYLGANTVFALLYMLQPGSVAQARAGSFRDHFFFSLETFATVGYGVMSPSSTYGHIICSVEILTGVFFTAALTGLIFSRFSRPRSRMLFSDAIVVGPHLDGQALMMRLANRRNRAMTDVAARLTLLHLNPREGVRQRRFIDLPLVRSSAPFIGLSWTLVHRLDADSPVRDLAAMMNDDPNLIIIASLTGYDETIAATVSARRLYHVADIRLGHGFVDIISLAEDGRVNLDLTRIHDTEELRDGVDLP